MAEEAGVQEDTAVAEHPEAVAEHPEAEDQDTEDKPLNPGA